MNGSDTVWRAGGVSPLMSREESGASQPPLAKLYHYPMNRRRSAVRRGLSLLEVILAIAILGGALVVIGELMRIGSRCAQAARELTTAQLLCESTLAEIAAGIKQAQPISRQPCETDSDWLYSVTSEQVDQGGLLSVSVTVEQDLPARKRPISFTLTRWIVDPDTEFQLNNQASSTSSTGSGTVSSSSGSKKGS